MSTSPSSTSNPQSSEELELLAFRLGDDEYCIDIMSVREIRGWTRPTPLPHTPPHLRGVINLRGTVLPVIDLPMRLGLAAVTGNSRNVIIVVNLGSQLAGLLVHAVSDILTLESGNLQPPPEVGTYVQQKFVRALAVVENRMIRLLNLPAVLPDISAEVA